MEKKVFLCESLIWAMMILLGQIHGYKGCIVKEREALLVLKTYVDAQTTWTNDTKSDCCRWENVECNHTTGRVIKLSLLAPYTKQINPLLNLSLLHPFEDIRSLNLSVYRMSGFTGLFDDVEGYRSLRRLRNLEILDFSYNQFNNSIFPFLNAATSLKTLILRSNYMDSHFPVKELKDLTNLEYLDLSENGFNGSIPVRGKVFLRQSLILAMILLGHIQGYKSCIVKEREALLELKTYIVSHSRFQNALPTWSKDTESDCCGWEGIKCNRTTGRVIKLSIQPRNLWFKERFLLNLSLLHPFEDVRSLHLSGSGLCKFTGLFDDVEGYKSLGRLRNLEILDLSSNEFNNSIFPFLNAATSLTTLFLRNNKLDDPFLVEKFKDLKNLELLDLSGNKYNSSISIRELSTMRKLKALDLSGNGFTESVELQELKNLTNLEVLGLARNSFSGPIPIEVFCEMKNIQELDLGENHFVGQIPQCLGSLSKLRVLDLSLNQISGNLPSSFSSLESLEYLSLSDNNFTGVVLLNPLTNLTKLKVFKLSSTSNMIQVEAESTWHPKFQLSAAQLSFCNMEKIPNFLIYQKNLRLVDLSNNRLSGHIPTWLLENNPELEVLELNNNSFNIFQLPTTLVHKLLVLDISANDISGVLPGNIGNALSNLLHLNGSQNGFQGDLPSSMGEMKSISFLDLSYNNFTGELPRSFVMGCFSLKVLKLSHNKFGGHFLTRRTNLTSLRKLEIDNNLLTGKIGVGLCSSVELYTLDMSNNRLTGAIPSWIYILPLWVTFLIDIKQFLRRCDTAICM